MFAAESGHEAVVTQLLQSSQVNMDLKDKYNRTAFFWAARKGQETVCLSRLYQ